MAVEEKDDKVISRTVEKYDQQKAHNATLKRIEDTKDMKSLFVGIKYNPKDLKTFEQFSLMVKIFCKRWLHDYDLEAYEERGEDLIKRLNELGINPEVEKYADKGFRFIVTWTPLKEEEIE